MVDQTAKLLCDGPDHRDPSGIANTNRARRRGNPRMVKGAPSMNPHGRPSVGLSLADAVRRRFPPERILAIAAAILDGDAPASVKQRTLEFLDRRGYGPRAATRPTFEELLAAPAGAPR